MNHEIIILIIAAASLGFFHTLFGPDHYLPFIVMAKARKWTLSKTIWITALCGLGHVGSSIVLGATGIALGIGVTQIEIIDGFRGNVAAWLLIAFGLTYFLWGLNRAVRKKSHTHFHIHSHGESHTHIHSHEKEHLHIHDKGQKRNITPWILFTIFLFGPCEPLIPVLMYPAAKSSASGLILVAIVFAFTTILTMLLVVVTTSFGIRFIPFKRFEMYTHAIAGATIFFSGLGIVFLGF